MLKLILCEKKVSTIKIKEPHETVIGGKGKETLVFYYEVTGVTQDPVPIVSWSCFYDAVGSDDGPYFISSAPTFQTTKAALAAVLRHFQWKYIVLVVDESQRFYVDLAAHVTYAIKDDEDFAIERFVHIRRGVTGDNMKNSLNVITQSNSRGLYCFQIIFEG